MGFFDKIKGAINDAKNHAAQQAAQRQEEERRRQEEERRRQEEERKKREEAERFNPDGKSLEWFCSEDGIKTFNEYVTAQNYLLEETIKKEHETDYSNYSFDLFVSVVHKEAKLPSIYFKKLVDTIKVQALEYVGTTKLLVRVLSMQAQPFYIDDEGEPQVITPPFTPEEIVSVDKNPVLNFVYNFNCFECNDDSQGSWEDKYIMWSNILIWLGIYGDKDQVTISQNPWIFSKETYFNDLGVVRKPKGFYKKCIELATDEASKEHFEGKYNECK